MTGLLVSVRSAAEAEIALAGGADIIDVKEPRRGALGPAEPRVWREINETIGGRATTTAALGELLDKPAKVLAEQAAGFRFAKIGLAHCDRDRNWMIRWERVVGSLPSGVGPVPVAYADWATARAPSLLATLTLAQVSPARLLLIDTYDKRGGGLLEHLPLESLRTISRQAQERDVQLVLAGSLDVQAIATLLELAPAYFGVRGAVCHGGRDGRIDLGRVKSLARLIRGTPQKVGA